MMAVGRVRMRMPQAPVPMTVTMRPARVDRPVVEVIVMFVVRVAMLVLQLLVLVHVLVPFGDMQPDTDGHQGARRNQLR